MHFLGAFVFSDISEKPSMKATGLGTDRQTDRKVCSHCWPGLDRHESVFTLLAWVRQTDSKACSHTNAHFGHHECSNFNKSILQTGLPLSEKDNNNNYCYSDLLFVFTGMEVICLNIFRKIMG